MLGTIFRKPIEPDQIEQVVERVAEDGSKYNETIMVDNPSGNTDSAYLRCVEWCDANGATIVDMGDYYLCTKAPERTLEELREDTLSRLSYLFNKALDEAYFLSALGYFIDANETAARNINDRILVMTDDEVTQFRDYHNIFHEANKSNLELMQREIILNKQRLYSIKWSLAAKIEAAKSIEELKAIDIEETL